MSVNKRNFYIKWLFLGAIIVVFVLLLPIFNKDDQAHAAEVIYHGSCGYSANYDVYDNGELRIYGTGSVTSNVFRNNSDYFDKLKIDEGITSIGDEVFWKCENLKSVELPDSLKSIGSEAFYGCKRMTTINLPDSVETVKEGAFRDCSKMYP